MSDDLKEAVAEPTYAEEVASLGADDLFDMVNLTKEDTGIDGVIYISTAVGAHGPRVKYYLRTKKDQPSFSVSISESPRVLASSLPPRVVNQMSPAVIEWVRANRNDLLKFWNSGNDLTRSEVNTLLDGLKKFAQP